MLELRQSIIHTISGVRSEVEFSGATKVLKQGRKIAENIFSNEADPAFRRRALWVGEMLSGPDVPKDAKLLDAGCGRGFYFPLYAQLGLSFTGLEADTALIDQSKRHAIAVGGTFQAGSVEAMPFPDATYDVVIFSEVLEHLKDPLRALREARRVLRPNGLLLVTVPNKHYPFLWDPLNFVLESLTGRHIKSGPLAGIWANHERLYSIEQLRKDVENSDFAVSDVFTHTSTCLPFVHNIVYGLGKPLFEAGALPKAWERSAKRGAGLTASVSTIDPVKWGIALVQWFDKFNKDRAKQSQRAQNICLSAHRRGI